MVRGKLGTRPDVQLEYGFKQFQGLIFERASMGSSSEVTKERVCAGASRPLMRLGIPGSGLNFK